MKFPPDTLEGAVAELNIAEGRAEEIRQLVAAGGISHSALHTAQWTVQQCRRRVERLKQQADYGDPLDAA